MRKRFLSTIMAAIMTLSLIPVTAVAEEAQQVPDRNTGYSGEPLPEGPMVSGNVWTVTPANAQYTLDGAYGSIDGKTIHFSEGTYEDVLVLARPTKYVESNTGYYTYNSELRQLDYADLASTGVYRYARTIQSVTFTADENVELPGFRMSSGHIYGASGNPAYDYVREISTESTNNSHFDYCSLVDVTFDGLIINGQVAFYDYSGDIQNFTGNTKIDSITFKNCTFQGNTSKMEDNTFAAVKMGADSQYFENVTVTGCTISDYFQGVYVQGVDSLTVTNCSIDNTTHNAIAVQSGNNSEVKGDIVITENVIQNANDRAIRFGEASEVDAVTVNNNIILNSGDSAGELIKAGTLPEDMSSFSLEHNYWDGKTPEEAVADNNLPVPTTTGVTGGTFSGLEDITAYCAKGYVPTQNPDGSFSVAYDDSGAFAGGDGTQGNPYQIANETQLAAFRDAVNAGQTYAGQYIELTADITLTAKPFLPVREFSGVFDGQGHTIYGYQNPVYETQAAYEADGNLAYDGTRLFTAFFTNLNGGTVKNLTFADYTISSSPVSNLAENQTKETGAVNPNHIYVSVAFGMLQNGATVDNVTVETGTVKSQVRAAGLAAYVKNSTGDEAVSTIKNSVNKADVSTTRMNDTYGTAAGILSTTGCGYFVIEGCSNEGTITGYVAGGIVGDIQQTGSILQGCTNSGAINGKAFAGGILGNYWYGGGGTIESCVNTGAVQSYQSEADQTSDIWKQVSIGGVIGAAIGRDESTATTITSSRNEGTVTHNGETVEAHVGGILGIIQTGYVTMTDCVNSGTITNLYYEYSTPDGDAKPFRTGGVVGDVRGGYNTLTDCISTGEIVVSENAYYGDIVGYLVSTPHDATSGAYANLWMDEGKVLESANKVLYTELTEINQPFGVLSPGSYSLLTVANNIKANIFNIGGNSYYVYNENSTEDHIQGKYTYDLTGCEIGTLNRLNIEGTNATGTSTSTVIIKGAKVDELVLFPEKDIPTWNYSLYYESDGGYIRSFVNNAQENPQGNTHNLIYNDKTFEETSGTLDVAWFTGDTGEVIAKTALGDAISAANGKPVTLINDVTETVSSAAVIYKNGYKASLTVETGFARTENGDSIVIYTAPAESTEYTVKYQLEELDGTYTDDSQVSAADDAAVQAALQKTYEGFTIASTEQTDTTYTVKYTRNTYTVTWKVDGVETSADYKFGAVIVKPTDPTKDGYTFAGWEGYTEGMTMPASDVTFTAQWTANTTSSGGGGTTRYTVTVEDSANGEVKSSHSRASRGTTVTLTITPDDGYVLDELVVTDANGDELNLTRKSSSQYTFTMPRSRVTVEASFVEGEEPDHDCPSEDYDDLSTSAWYHNAVDYVLSEGMMSGVSRYEFAPDDTLTRAMVVQILWAMEGKPQVDYLMRYDDVASGAWYAEAIRWGVSEGIVSGYSESTFGPEDPVTREQLMTILYAYAQQKDLGFTGNWMFQLDYADADAVSTWAYEAACWCTMENVVSGKSGNQLDPAGTATRAEAAQMLMNFSLVLDEA